MSFLNISFSRKKMTESKEVTFLEFLICNSKIISKRVEPVYNTNNINLKYHSHFASTTLESFKYFAKICQFILFNLYYFDINNILFSFIY